MEIEYKIPDDKVRDFTDSAKRRLQEQSLKYTMEIIDEAEKVEELIREDGASIEITDSVIFQAVRRNKTGKKRSPKIIVTRIVAEVLLFISGLMFEPEVFITEQNTFNLGYFVLFAIVTLMALIATIITYFIGGE